MNTKFFKEVLIILLLTALPLAFLFYKKISTAPTPRKIAVESTIDYSKLTQTQKEKWTIIEKIKIQTDKEAVILNIPHITDICQSDTQYIIFTFKAYQNLIAGQNPNIKIHLSCKNPPRFPLHIFKSELVSLQQNSISKTDEYYLQAHLLYKDEPYPNDWSLQEIQIQGESSYLINQFEIQSVFQHNFEFEMF